MQHPSGSERRTGLGSTRFKSWPEQCDSHHWAMILPRGLESWTTFGGVVALSGVLLVFAGGGVSLTHRGLGGMRGMGYGNARRLFGISWKP